MKFSSAKQPYKCIAISLLVFSFLVLQGCGSGKKGITIDSQPQGANVIADGKKIGVTPVHIRQDDVFPPHWYGSSYMVKGDLEIKKEGCDGFSMKVNDAVLMNDIKANLKCSPGMMKPSTAPAAAKPATKNIVKDSPAAKTAEPAKPPTAKKAKPVTADAGIEERLVRLKSLRDKGVITADEYAAQRKRILDTL